MESPPQPDKKIAYPIAHDETGGALYLYGSCDPSRKDKQKVVLCCPGWPDDHTVFMPLACRLAKEKDCFVGVICLPGFDDRPERPWRKHWKDGYTLEEMVAAVKEGAKALMAEVTSLTNRDIDYTAICHDWGVIVGMMQINRAWEEAKDSPSKPHLSLIPNQIVLMDIGLPFHPKDQGKPQLRPVLRPDKTMTLHEACVDTAYRVILATMFLLQRYVSGYLAVLTFVIGSGFLRLTRTSPSTVIDDKTIQDRNPNPLQLAYTSYPYYKVGRDLVTGNAHMLDQHATLPILDHTDILFMYGTEKRSMFHDKRMVEYLNDFSSKGGQSCAVQIDGGGHWFFVQQPEKSFQEICKFMERENRRQ